WRLQGLGPYRTGRPRLISAIRSTSRPRDSAQTCGNAARPLGVAGARWRAAFAPDEIDKKRQKPLPTSGIFCARLERPPFGVLRSGAPSEASEDATGASAAWPVVGIHASA